MLNLSVEAFMYILSQSPPLEAFEDFDFEVLFNVDFPVDVLIGLFTLVARELPFSEFLTGAYLTFLDIFF